MCTLHHLPWRNKSPQPNCYRLSMPSGRQEPIDGSLAHRHGDAGTFTTADGDCIHVYHDDQDGDEPGGAE